VEVGDVVEHGHGARGEQLVHRQSAHHGIAPAGLGACAFCKTKTGDSQWPNAQVIQMTRLTVQ
jgi:hypothetical protein